MVSQIDRRPSPIAGLWYAGDPQTLASQVDHYIANAASPQIQGDVVGIIAPHAGYRYSGKTAGHAFRCIQGATPDLVAVVSPMHAYMSANVMTTAHEAYATPLGNIMVDRKSLIELESNLHETGVEIQKVKEDTEHSLEIELPFLQRSLEMPFSLLPLMVRTQSSTALENLGRALAQVLKSQSSLLVASTDLSHFFPEDTANRLDAEMLAQIEAFSPQGVLETEHSGRGYACGAAAVATTLWAARHLGADTVKILHHSTSAEETGDTNSVVGYAAAVIYKHS